MTGSTCTRHGRKFGLLCIFLVAILLFILDAVVQPCREVCAADNMAVVSNSSAENVCSTPGSRKTGCMLLLFRTFTEWLKQNLALGTVLFCLLYALCTVCIIPTTPLTLGGGFAFTQAMGLGAGLVMVSFTVLVGASLGAILAFMLGRYLLHAFVQRLIQRWSITKAIDNALRLHSLKLMILCRLSPIIPFNVFNYAISGTSVSFRHYALALPAMLPGTFSYAFLGAGVAEAVGDVSPSTSAQAHVQRITYIGGAVATAAAVLLLSCVARRELNRSLHDVEGAATDTPAHTHTAPQHT